jgi:acetamidase/formamidase
MKNVDLTRIHYLSGPFEVETAEPGDVLLVEIMDVQPHQKHPWGLLVFRAINVVMPTNAEQYRFASTRELK